MLYHPHPILVETESNGSGSSLIIPLRLPPFHPHLLGSSWVGFYVLGFLLGKNTPKSCNKVWNNLDAQMRPLWPLSAEGAVAVIASDRGSFCFDSKVPKCGHWASSLVSPGTSQKGRILGPIPDLLYFIKAIHAIK